MNKNFFTQLFARLAQDNPEFFKLIQYFAIALGAISAAFSFIDTTHTALPAWLMWVEHNEVWVTSFTTAVLAQLPNKDINSNNRL